MSYSQNDEEEIVFNYFGHKEITCLSLGENDGQTLSNVRQIILNGSQAVLVEPAPIAFKKLHELYNNRIDVVCLNVAVADYCGKAKFHDSGSHISKNDTSLLSSLSKEEIKRWEPSTEFNEIEVDVINFKVLLDLSPYKKFDLISIDCEGQDYCILSQMDLVALETKMLILEFNGKDQEAFDALVIPQGFQLLHKNAENLIYVKSN